MIIKNDLIFFFFDILRPLNFQLPPNYVDLSSVSLSIISDFLQLDRHGALQEVSIIILHEPNRSMN